MNAHLTPSIELQSSSPHVVRKIGGSRASELESNLQRFQIAAALGQKQDVVLSAARIEGFNTTDHLIELAQAIRNTSEAQRARALDALNTFLKENLVDKQANGDKRARAVIQAGLAELQRQCELTVVPTTETKPAFHSRALVKP